MRPAQARIGENLVEMLAPARARARRTLRRPLAWPTPAALAGLALIGVLGGAPAAAGAAARAKITINLGRRYQQIAGFGVSEGFGQARTLMSMPAAVQQRVISLLYSPTRGAGLTILRNEISADKGFTIEPKAPTGPNARPSYLTLAQIDQDQGQLWFAKQIKAAYGVSDVFADAWSAPAFMKTDDSAFDRGTVCGVPGAACKRGDWRQAYANYLVQYAKEYAAAGLPLSYVGPENESNPLPPGAHRGGGAPVQDSMSMSATQTANFMQVLGQALAKAGLATRAECCASISWEWAQQYAAAIESDKAASAATALFTSHGYIFPPNSPLKGWSKPVWETEWAPLATGPFDAAWDDGSQNSGFAWAQNIYTGLTRANLSAFLYLWGANTNQNAGTGGPNGGLLEVANNRVSSSGRLWAFANYSRFIRPGAVRVAADASGGDGLEVTAFRNSNGSLAVIALNSAHHSQTASFALPKLAAARVTPYLTDATHQVAPETAIAVKNGAFTATLPPRSLVTYDS